MRRRAAEWLTLAVLACALVAVLRAALVPAAFLLGPMIAAIALAIRGAKARLPRSFTIVAQAILGCLIAGAIDAELMHIIAGHWWILIVFSVATLVLAAALGVWIARAGWLPGTTAIWGLSPGAAAAMVLLAEDHGADQRMVALMQYSRIAMVAFAAILVAKVMSPASAAHLASLDRSTHASLPTLAVTLALIVVGASIALYFSRSSAALFVPALLGAGLQATGMLSVAVPPLLASFAFGTVGIYVGLSFTREVLVHSLRVLPRMLAAIAVMIAGCGLLSLAFGALIPSVDPLTAYLALSPGGIDAAVIIASQADVTLPLILAAQFVRLVLVMSVAPPLAQWLTSMHLRRGS